MNQETNRGCTLPLLSRLAGCYRWLHAPIGLLVVLLQRTPVIRLADRVEWVTEVCTGSAVRSLFALGALGAYDSLAGATTSTTTGTTTTTVGTTTTTTTTTTSTINFAVANATPASGPAGTAFAVTADIGVATDVGFTLTGGVTNPKSWKVTGTLPDGLSVYGGNPVNVSLPYKMRVVGTPTTAGTWVVTVTAYQGVDQTGSASDITCTFSVAKDAIIAPSITTQPTDASGVLGKSVTFTAAASGFPAPTYKWFHDSKVISGETSASLTLSSLQSSDAGNYTMTATNSASTVTSAAAVLTVTAAAVAPAITTQPQSVTVAELSTAAFSTTATGTVTLTYQWKKDGTVISGASTSSFEIPLVHLTDAGNYTVTVTNSAGAVTSSAATLTVNALQAAPTIVVQPQGATLTAGAAASMSVAANGTATLTYQWSKNGVALPGATASSYSVPVLQTSDAGNYTVTVANTYGSVTSNPATLNVSAAQVAPSIVTQPQSETVSPGASASFSVVASGNATLAYQWMLGSTALAGATNASYTNASVQASDAGSYTVVVSNAYGSTTSKAATLTVSSSSGATTAPSFTAQPSSDTVASGHSVSFAATTSGNPAATYQWQLSTDNGTSWSSLADSATYKGTASPTLTISSVSSPMNSYRYRLIATNAAGSTTTNVLTLTVASPPFPGPSGVAVDASGNLFVSDGSNNTVQFVTPAGVAGLLAGAAGQQGSTDGSYASALFRQPRAVALDKSEVLYVADTGNSLIRKISPAGVVVTLAGSSSTQGYVDSTGTAAVFNSPQALTVDTNGNIYVADTGNSAIRKVSPAGVVTTVAGTGFGGSADGTGNLALFNQPTGIAVDTSGNLYVADTNNNTIRKIASGSVVTTLAGVPGVGGYADGAGVTALFNHPTGLALDNAGNLYVADTGNEVIRVVAPDGTVRLLAGLPTIAGLLDGTGTAAWFNQPESLSIDSSGNLYVADNGNAAIRKVTSAGVVTTLVLQQSSTTPAVPVPATTSAVTTPTSTGTTSTSTGSSGGGALDPRLVLGLLFLAAVRRRRQLAATRRS